jgi:branched-chain amino acid transport system substrate-binding protein
LKRIAILAMLLALVLTACPEEDPELVETDPGTDEEPEPEPEPDDDVADEPDDDADDEPAADGEPVRIGVLMPRTGFGATAGEEAINAFELYWEQNDYQSGGTPIEVVYGDTESDASAGAAEARRLVESENIDILVGPIVGAVALAVGDLMQEMDVPQIYGVPTNDVWLREGMPETLFTIEATTAEMAMHMGRWAAEEGGFERVATVCSDYVTGWETCGGFVNTFTTYGGEIVEQLWPPAGGAPDYAPIISRLEAVEYDAIYMGTPVGDGVLFFTALSEFGLAGETQVLGHKVVIDPGTLAAYGPEAAGILSSAPYAEGNERISDFVTAFEEEYGQLPGTTGGAKYFIAELIDAALQELGGTVPENASEFIDVLESLELSDSIYGNWTTDDEGNAIHDHYLREVEDRGDGTLWNVVNETWEGLGPGHVFDLDAYFAQPPYDQSYQGIDWPESCDDFVDQADCPDDLQ